MSTLLAAPMDALRPLRGAVSPTRWERSHVFASPTSAGYATAMARVTGSGRVRLRNMTTGDTSSSTVADVSGSWQILILENPGAGDRLVIEALADGAGGQVWVHEAAATLHDSLLTVSGGFVTGGFGPVVDESGNPIVSETGDRLIWR